MSRTDSGASPERVLPLVSTSLQRVSAMRRGLASIRSRDVLSTDTPGTSRFPVSTSLCFRRVPRTDHHPAAATATHKKHGEKHGGAGGSKELALEQEHQRMPGNNQGECEQDAIKQSGWHGWGPVGDEENSAALRWPASRLANRCGADFTRAQLERSRGRPHSQAPSSAPIRWTRQRQPRQCTGNRASVQRGSRTVPPCKGRFVSPRFAALSQGQAWWRLASSEPADLSSWN